MQAKPKILKVFLVALIASLLLGACYGGSSERVWFNLPSLPLRLDSNGAASLYGLPVGAILPATQVQQFQAGDIQKLEARAGYNGLHVELNGDDLPYVAWDEASTAKVQEVIQGVPGVPNADTIASALPWLRKIGLGAILYIPPADGAAAISPERWSGEKTVTPETPEETTIGPMTLGLISFNEDGSGNIQNVPVSVLEEALGTAIPLKIDPSLMATLSQLGAETLSVATQPNGVDLSMNDQPLPGIAYDTSRLNALLKYSAGLGIDPATQATLDKVVPLLPGAAVNAVVSFTGEPAVATEIAPVVVDIQPDGKAEVMGFPVAEMPADLMDNLKAANVQQLNVDVAEDGLFLASNGQLLPSITWNDESIETLANVVAPMAGMSAAGINSLLGIAHDTGLSTVVNVPAGEGAAPVDAAGEISRSFAPVDLGDMAPPTIRLDATFDSAGNLKSLGNLPAAAIGPLSDITLSPDAMAALTDLGAGELSIVTEANQLNILMDGETALSVGYDVPSLQAALELAAPFLGDTPLSDPAVNQLLIEQILPLLPASNLDVTVVIE